MNSHYAQYYLRQQGSGLADIGAIYRAPIITQRGRGGIGSFFSGAYNFLRPLFSSGVEALKSQAIKSGASILDNVGKKPFKEILKEQGKIAMEDLAFRGANKLKRKFQGGEGRSKKKRIMSRGQGGEGRRKKKSQGGEGRKKKKPQGGEGRRKRRKNIKRRNKTNRAHSTLKRKRVGQIKRTRKSRIIDIFNN